MFPSRYFIWALSKNWLKLPAVHITVIFIKFTKICESDSSCLIVILFRSLFCPSSYKLAVLVLSFNYSRRGWVSSSGCLIGDGFWDLAYFISVSKTKSGITMLPFTAAIHLRDFLASSNFCLLTRKLGDSGSTKIAKNKVIIPPTK